MISVFTNSTDIRRRSSQKGISWIHLLKSFVFLKPWTGICVIRSHFLVIAFEIVKNIKKGHCHKTSKDCTNVHLKNSNQQDWNNRNDQKVPPPKSQDDFSAFPNDVFLNFRRCILIFFHSFNIPQIRLIKT